MAAVLAVLHYGFLALLVMLLLFVLSVARRHLDDGEE